MIMPVLLLTIFGYIQWQVNVFSYSILTSGLTICLLVAIAEELLFRGFIFQRLITSFGVWPAQFVLAGLFLLTHINNPGMTGIIKTLASINIFIASIMFGIAYIKTKSLAMPLAIHFMANFTQGTVLGFGVSGGKDPSLLMPEFNNAPLWLSGGDFGIEASILGLFFVLVITLLLYYRYPAKEK
jgi:membrane protease YdiL (CAAX protease family)